MQDIAAYLAILTVYVSLNLTWVSLVALDLYRRELATLLLEKPRAPPAGLFYLLHAAGVLVLAVQPALARGDWRTATLHGALFGLCTYGTYDLTNAATLRRWPGTLMILDLACGVLLTALAAAAGFFAARTMGADAP